MFGSIWSIVITSSASSDPALKQISTFSPYLCLHPTLSHHPTLSYHFYLITILPSHLIRYDKEDFKNNFKIKILKKFVVSKLKRDKV